MSIRRRLPQPAPTPETDSDADTGAINSTLERLAAIIAAAPPAVQDAAVAEARGVVERLVAWRLPTASPDRQRWAVAAAMVRVVSRSRSIMRSRLLSATDAAGRA